MDPFTITVGLVSGFCVLGLGALYFQANKKPQEPTEEETLENMDVQEMGRIMMEELKDGENL